MISGLISILERKVEAAEHLLLDKTVTGFIDKLEKTEGGRIRNTLHNKRMLSAIDTIFAKYGKASGIEIAKTILGGVKAITNFNNGYFGLFASAAKLLPIQDQVQENVKAWLGLTDKGTLRENGYLDTIIKDTTLKNQIKNVAIKSVIGQGGWMEGKEAIKETLIGTDAKAGKMKQYYRNFVYDTYSEVDRATSEVYADNLKLEFAIYEGGIIKTSRPFCRKRNGKVFHKSEIILFDPPTAKQPDYNPFLDLGGYGCRHHLNYIPNTVAFMLRPDARELVGKAANLNG